MCLLLGETIKQTQRTLVKRQQILHFCSLLYWVVVACNILLHHFRFVTMGMAYPVVTNAPDINMPIFVTINNIISVINKMIQVCHKIGRTCVPNVVSQTSSGSRLLPKCFNVCPKTQLVPGLSQNPNGPLLVPKTKRFNVCPKTIKICSKLVKKCHLSQMYKKNPEYYPKSVLNLKLFPHTWQTPRENKYFFLKKAYTLCQSPCTFTYTTKSSSHVCILYGENPIIVFIFFLHLYSTSDIILLPPAILSLSNNSNWQISMK